MQNSIKLFEDKLVRSIWDEQKEEWVFSIVDVVEVLTDSKDLKQYLKKIKSRDSELKTNWGTICTLVQMVGKDGKKREIQAGTVEGILRLVQSIPSKKEKMLLPVRNFMLGTNLHFAFSNENFRIPYKNSYFVIDQLYYHLDSKRNVLLKITHKILSIEEKEKFIEQINYYNSIDKYNNENDAVGLIFTVNAKTTEFNYVIPTHLPQNLKELNLPSENELKEKLDCSIDDLRMN